MDGSHVVVVAAGPGARVSVATRGPRFSPYRLLAGIAALVVLAGLVFTAATTGPPGASWSPLTMPRSQRIPSSSVPRFPAIWSKSRSRTIRRYTPARVLAHIDDRDYRTALAGATRRCRCRAGRHRKPGAENRPATACGRGGAGLRRHRSGRVDLLAAAIRALCLARAYRRRHNAGFATMAGGYPRKGGGAGARHGRSRRGPEADRYFWFRTHPGESHAGAATGVQHQAELNLSYTVITAPADGTVGDRTLRVGQYVQAGTALMAVVPLSAVYVTANYKETQLTDVHPGQPVYHRRGHVPRCDRAWRGRQHRAGQRRGIRAAAAR